MGRPEERPLRRPGTTEQRAQTSLVVGPEQHVEVGLPQVGVDEDRPPAEMRRRDGEAGRGHARATAAAGAGQRHPAGAGEQVVDEPREHRLAGLEALGQPAGAGAGFGVETDAAEQRGRDPLQVRGAADAIVEVGEHAQQGDRQGEGRAGREHGVEHHARRGRVVGDLGGLHDREQRLRRGASLGQARGQLDQRPGQPVGDRRRPHRVLVTRDDRDERAVELGVDGQPRRQLRDGVRQVQLPDQALEDGSRRAQARVRLADPGRGEDVVRRRAARAQAGLDDDARLGLVAGGQQARHDERDQRHLGGHRDDDQDSGPQEPEETADVHRISSGLRGDESIATSPAAPGAVPAVPRHPFDSGAGPRPGLAGGRPVSRPRARGAGRRAYGPGRPGPGRRSRSCGRPPCR